MAKKPSQKAIWEANAKAAREELTELVASEMMPGDEADIVELEELTPRARGYKTTKGRSGVYYEVFRDRIRELMLQQNLVEFVAGRTQVTLAPNFEMGDDDKGYMRYCNLVDTYGKDWADARVMTTTNRYHAHRGTRITQDPRVNNGLPQHESFHVGYRSVVTWKFIGQGTAAEEIAWTVALGNNPRVDIGDIPERAKEGKDRNDHKKKTP